MNTTKKISNSLIRSILAFGLLAFFLFQSVLVFIFFEVKRSQIRHEVKEEIIGKIPENRLVKIIQEGSFTEKEFLLNGKMYDVVKKKFVDGKTILLCFEDDKETALHHEIENQIEGTLDNHPSKKNQQKLIDFLKILFVESENNFAFSIDSNKQISNFFYLEIPYSAFHSPQFIPPISSFNLM